MGRRSTLPGWLAGLGAARPPRRRELGFTYYTRYFRSATGSRAPPFLVGLLTPFDSYSLLALPGDAGTWSVTVYISSRDQALKDLRQSREVDGSGCRVSAACATA